VRLVVVFFFFFFFVSLQVAGIDLVLCAGRYQSTRYLRSRRGGKSSGRPY
jgi:hypothetical protein